MLAGPPTAPVRPRWVYGALLLALGGCGKPPGFEVQWTIDSDAPDVAPLMSKQCSEVGISSVRVTVERAGSVVSVDEYPCFSGAGEGPSLEPGEYDLFVEGLRRNGEPWDFDEESGLARVAYAESTVTVSDGTVPLVEVVLLAPPECDDGIDNDRDGVVDSQDPGCGISTATAEPRESNDSELTLFQVSVSFLQSPVVEPYNVGVSSVRLEIDGEPFVEFEDFELDMSQWPYRLPLLSGEFEPGMYELSITALGPDGGPVTESLVDPEQVTFTVEDNAAGYVIRDFDFASEQFLAPIEAPLRLGFVPNCTPGGSLNLERVWIRVVDDADQPLDLATLQLTGTTTVGGSVMSIVPQAEADGWISFECPSSSVQSLPLTWGRYRIEAQSRLGDISCFSLPQTELAPQPVSAQILELERELIDGLPACPECDNDNDCDAQVCEEGLCVDKDPTG